MEDDYLMLSALRHYAVCPRQFALIHVEQVWSENRFTAEGRLLHERADSGEAEQRPGIRTERSVSVISHQLGITGKLDVLEIESSDPLRYIPVEFKRGKPKVENWDRVQLCAQALCLEEMLNVSIDQAALWYWQVRKRQWVNIDANLRSETIGIIDAARTLLTSGKTPPPVNDQRCDTCSLLDFCEPKALQKDRSTSYVNGLFKE